MAIDRARFGPLLRQSRVEAELTQEALAELADLSPRSIQKLERGETLPYPVTVQRLARVLRLRAEQRAQFQAAGARTRRGSAPASALSNVALGSLGGTLPHGTLTFLLLRADELREPGDAEGDRASALDTLTRAVERHGGWLLPQQAEGSRLVAVFRSAGDAIAAAAAAERSLLAGPGRGDEKIPADEAFDASVVDDPLSRHVYGTWVAGPHNLFIGDLMPVRFWTDVMFVASQRILAGEIGGAQAGELAYMVTEQWKAANPDTVNNYSRWGRELGL